MTENPVTYTSGLGRAPLILIKNACQSRANGRPCSLYERKEEVIEGKKAVVHYCNGNYVWCDWITGVAFELSDAGSDLYQKVKSEEIKLNDIGGKLK